MAEQNTRAESVSTGRELSDISPNKVLWFGLGLALVIVAVVLINYGLFHYFHRSETGRRLPPSPLSYGVEPPPEPRLLTKPGVDLAEMRAEEDRILNTYGWIDRDRGVVRLPIDRAIALLAEKGLPTRGESNGERTKEKAKR
ncbi:MAG TPA: hypothetical protein VGH22_10245 [Candidatus Binatia bacterium]|jgi:hypothetical protein